MKSFYVPVLKAKSAEFTALSHVHASQAKSILPIMEVPLFPSHRKSFQGSSTKNMDYLQEVVDGLEDNWSGRTIFIDPKLWSHNATVENGEHVIPFLCKALRESSVTAYPVINIDLWGSEQYRRAFRHVDVGADGLFCIRLDAEAVQEAADDEYFNESLDQVVDYLGVPESNFCVMLDMGDVRHVDFDDLTEQLAAAVTLLAERSFRFIVVSGCTIPASINEAVKAQNSEGYVDRIELSAWKYLLNAFPSERIIFSDYGVRSPQAMDGIAPDANGKIRYAIPDQYYIVRGHSRRKGNKGAQAHDLARKLVASDHYMGPKFSWGDAQILIKANTDKKPGNPTDWIAIDTSHHLAAVLAEVLEYVSQKNTSVTQQQ